MYRKFCAAGGMEYNSPTLTESDHFHSFSYPCKYCFQEEVDGDADIDVALLNEARQIIAHQEGL